METSEKHQLDPRIKIVWRLSYLGILLFYALILILPFALVALDPETPQVITTLAWIFTLIGVVGYLILAIIVVPICYARWHYSLNENFVEIERGIWWRRHFVVPFIRVQNTDTKQGPILRACGLASVTISTAAGMHTIPGLVQSEAEELRDRAAEYARVAREDI